MILQEQTTIQLDENRIITIESLFQIRTYRNLLCGIPTRELNKSAIESALKSAKQYIENIESIFIIEPKEIPIIIDSGIHKNKEYFKIPETTCIAKINYSKLLNHDVISNINQLHIENILEVDHHFKSFGLIWFQQDLGFQISDSLLKEFQNKLP